MTTRVTIAIVVALTLVVISESVLLLRTRHEIADLRHSEHDRRSFCSSYRLLIGTLKNSFANPTSAHDPSFEYLLYNVTTNTFVDLCHVAEPTRSKATRRTWGCERKDLVAPANDYTCLSRFAAELEAAIPIEAP